MKAILAALLPLLAGPAGPPASVLLLEGPGRAGRIAGIAEGRLRLDAGGPAPLALDLAVVESLHLRPAAQESPRGPALFLPGGESIPVDKIQGGRSGGVQAVRRGLPLPEIPLDRIHGFRREGVPAGSDGIAAALAEPQERDLLFLRGPDGVVKAAGALLSLGPDEAVAELAGEERRLPLDRLQGAVLAGTGGSLPPQPAAVFLHAGGRLSGRLAGADEETLRLQHPLLGEVALSWDEVAEVECARERVHHLSGETPLRDEATPAFDRVWPVARDRTLQGGPIVLGGRSFRRGLCFLPRRALTFVVPPGAGRFRATVGFAPEAGTRGAARFRVLADGLTLWEAERRAADPPLDLDLPCPEARTLTLAADFGPDLDLGDQCVYASPRLILPRPAREER